MLDAYGRTIDYLRLSITDRCNLRCRYCMPVEVPFVEHEKILRYEEILRICAIAASLGIRHLKVTGGEPLVRRGCAGLIQQLKALEGIETVTLTTNGTLLSQQLDSLVEAGLDGVNISLDTLNPQRYAAITGKNELSNVIDGMEKALKAGLRVKLNCVPLAHTPEAELVSLASLAERHPMDVRFIEMMPIGNGAAFAAPDFQKLLEALRRRWPDLHPSSEKRGFGPAHYFRSDSLQGSIGLIDAMSHSFCGRCNRVRLTSEGYLKLCLCHSEGVDLRELLRSGASDGQLRQAIAEAIAKKPARHSFQTCVDETRNMSQIGG